MTGSSNLAGIGLFLIFIVLNQLQNSDAAYSMSDTCLYLSKGYIGDPTNCQNWGYCQNGKLLHVGSCQAGMLYDTRKAMCNYASQVQCSTTVETACKSVRGPAYISDPNNCASYAYCKLGIAFRFTCKAGMVFNPQRNLCVYPETYQCPADSICRLVANNAFVGDPFRCGNYVRCQDGTGYSQTCADNYKFNPLTGYCEKNYDCNKQPKSEPSNTIPPTNTNICSKWSATGNQTIQYFSDSLTCYGYYACNSASSVGIWGGCPFATHFNPTLQDCVTPYSYACPYNRCGNLNLTFVSNIGCADYTVCNNQQPVSTGSCSADSPSYPWFDEYAGGCVGDKPTQQAVCATPTTTPTPSTPATTATATTTTTSAPATPTSGPSTSAQTTPTSATATTTLATTTTTLATTTTTSAPTTTTLATTTTTSAPTTTTSAPTTTTQKTP